MARSSEDNVFSEQKDLGMLEIRQEDTHPYSELKMLENEGKLGNHD